MLAINDYSNRDEHGHDTYEGIEHRHIADFLLMEDF
jgi:hypothetical protein